MRAHELIALLEQLDPNQQIDFIVSDDNDNFDAVLYLNEYGGEDRPKHVELTLQLDENYFIDRVIL